LDVSGAKPKLTVAQTALYQTLLIGKAPLQTMDTSSLTPLFMEVEKGSGNQNRTIDVPIL